MRKPLVQPEQQTLKPVIERIKQRFNDMKISDNIFDSDLILTADTGFSDESNMQYLHEENINGYIPDNQFRSRDPKFAEQKKKYPRASRATGKYKSTIPASEFSFDPVTLSCKCPKGKSLHLCGIRQDAQNRDKAHFVGRVKHCRDCHLRHKCMKNPEAVNRPNGVGRQVTFKVNQQSKPNYTDWMKHRVDSDKGKQIYSHRMSVVEPVFGNICSNKKLQRFTLRTKEKVDAQWKLFCLIQNIEKIAHYGKIAA